MYIEITSPTDGRVFIRQDSIASVVVGKAKGDPYLITTLAGTTYSVIVATEQHTLARLIGMRS
ncbi:MAG TPA: hypothetical protein VH105_05530 [Burkholderiales bacterium]|jgi:hypothetical protein|nr:hypothetical protein [Burkholderiales bacterium]